MKHPRVWLLALTVLYLVVSAYTYAWYHQRVSPPDAVPFVGTGIFGLVFASGLLIAVGWVRLFLPKKIRVSNSKKAVLILAMLLFGIPLVYADDFNPIQDVGGDGGGGSGRRANVDKMIDVLGAGDEEFDILYPEGNSRYLGWEIYINSAFDYFHVTFDLHFTLRGWIHWDSDDAQYSMPALLDEAVTDTGFEFQKTQFEGYPIDLLLVFTGHILTDKAGWSSPEDYACIFHWSPEYPRIQLLMHEITHQWELDECGWSNQCVMAMETSYYFPCQWCEECKLELEYDHDFMRFYRWY